MRVHVRINHCLGLSALIACAACMPNSSTLVVQDKRGCWVRVMEIDSTTTIDQIVDLNGVPICERQKGAA